MERPTSSAASKRMNIEESDATMAVFLDLENIALGAQDAHYPRFEIQKILERLLLKGHIVVKKAYCDFDRYKDFKRGLHEAAFEMIEIPHVRQSGKNSADIRMVVDALDLCYTKGHVDTFVIISGDSDFSPLVSKLRENAKMVIGVGVKNSTSDLFINNCDEFLYYDDFVRAERARQRSAPPSVAAAPTTAASAPRTTVTETAAPKGLPLIDALEEVMKTIEALTQERDESEPIWGSMIKQAIKRRNPGFNERAYGFRSFNDLLMEAQKRDLLKLEADEKSGGYLVRVVPRTGVPAGRFPCLLSPRRPGKQHGREGASFPLPPAACPHGRARNSERYLTSRAGQGWKAGGKCGGQERNLPPHDAARAGFHPSSHSSRWNAAPCHGRRSNRLPPSAAAIRATSRHLQQRGFRPGLEMRQRLLPAILQHALNGTRQVAQAFLARHALAVRLRHFGTSRDQKRLSWLNDGCELVSHGEIHTRCPR